MANNIADSVVTLVAPAATENVYSLEVTKFKSAKFIVSVVDNTAQKTRSFEVFLTFTLAPIVAQYQKYTEIGDSIVAGVYEFTFDAVFDDVETINLTVENLGDNELEVLVGEIERIE